MIKKTTDTLKYFQFPHFTDHESVVHGLFSRIGGYSEGDFQGFNMSTATGDTPERVQKNREMLIYTLGMKRLVTLKQVHGTEVYCYESHAGHENDQVEADAVLTHEKGVLLLIQTADCQAVLLHDPVKGVVGNIHAGWRGSVANIIGKTVGSMTRRYGSNPADIRAGVGPSLGPCCAEFVNYELEIPKEYWGYKDDRHHFDFWRISADQLINAGLKEENIRLSGFCTQCNKDLFFSYRRDKLTGRLANVIGLR